MIVPNPRRAVGTAVTVLLAGPHPCEFRARTSIEYLVPGLRLVIRNDRASAGAVSPLRATDADQITTL